MPNLPGNIGIRRPKYQELIDALSNDISSGRYKPGQKLPSEAGLVKKFQTSRITVGRALRELQQKGLIERVAGSGSYVRGELERGLLFGLLIPDLGETEIFDPICHGIANAPEAGDHACLGSYRSAREQQSGAVLAALSAVHSRRVTGVFFAPLEFEGEATKTNRRILNAFREANIPVVLLDRRPSAMPERVRADLVGLNNRQAGFVATEHLAQLGCTKRIGFIAYQAAEATVEGRMAGYRDALRKYGLQDVSEPSAQIGANDRIDLPGGDLPKGEEIEAFVCVNDHVAGVLMHAFLSRGVRIPQDIRLVGIDDVKYASLLPVPLTTVRQPCPAIGQAAMQAMLGRIASPKAPSREILFDGELVIRRSCGNRL